VLEGAVGAGVTNWICVLPIFDRPNKTQLSIGAIKVIVVPGLSPRRFGLSPGSSTNAVQVLLAEIIAATTRPASCTFCCGFGVCPSAY